jgi:hypothetical protein
LTPSFWSGAFALNPRKDERSKRPRLNI